MFIDINYVYVLADFIFVCGLGFFYSKNSMGAFDRCLCIWTLPNLFYGKHKFSIKLFNRKLMFPVK